MRALTSPSSRRSDVFPRPNCSACFKLYDVRLRFEVSRAAQLMRPAELADEPTPCRTPRDRTPHFLPRRGGRPTGAWGRAGSLLALTHTSSQRQSCTDHAVHTPAKALSPRPAASPRPPRLAAAARDARPEGGGPGAQVGAAGGAEPRGGQDARWRGARGPGRALRQAGHPGERVRAGEPGDPSLASSRTAAEPS